MQVRSFRPSDTPHLERLLGQIWGSEPHALSYYRPGPDSEPDSRRFFRTLVAEHQGIVAGFGTAWTNPFHPHALYVSVNVHPAWRGQGAGASLLEALGAFNTTGLPLQGCTWATSAAGVRFAERHGFQVARRTYEPMLHIADVDIDAYQGFTDRCAAHGYSLVSLTELPPSDQQLAALLREVYTATHGINPPRPMEIEGWIDTLHRDPPDPEGSFVAVHGGEYAAMSMAHRDSAEHLSLSWAGVAERHRQHERDLMLALTLCQIKHAAATGAALLEAEFDSTDPWAMIRLGAFPFRPAPCWLTFQRT